MTSRRYERIDCEFCGQPICEFFADINASALIHASVISHRTRCETWPVAFAGDILLTYCTLLVEGYRRKRLLAPVPLGESPARADDVPA